MKKQTNKKLEVTTIVVRDLSSTEMKAVVGGQKKTSTITGGGTSVI